MLNASFNNIIITCTCAMYIYIHAYIHTCIYIHMISPNLMIAVSCIMKVGTQEAKAPRTFVVWKAHMRCLVVGTSPKNSLQLKRKPYNTSQTQVPAEGIVHSVQEALSLWDKLHGSNFDHCDKFIIWQKWEVYMERPLPGVCFRD